MLCLSANAQLLGLSRMIIWRGEGELVPHLAIRWLVPGERIRFSTEAIWLSDTVWVVRDRYEFSSGRILEKS